MVIQNILKNYTIAYVEDDPAIQRNMKELLVDIFAEVWLRSDGKAGFELYRSKRPDVMMLDIDLPYMDGLSLAKKIRRIDKRTKIVILTAYTDKEKLLQATGLKLVKYIVKPIDLVSFDDLLDTLAVEFMEESGERKCFRDGYRWDHLTLKLTHHGREVPLTVKESLLMDLLVRNSNSPVAFEDIMAIVWEDSFDNEVSIGSVKSLVSKLRKKLPQNTIQNAYGIGYLLRCVTPH